MKHFALALALSISFVGLEPLEACTGTQLRAEDGSVLYGRTLEWGSFEMNSRVAVVPRGHAFVGKTPDGKPGVSWKAKHGFVAVDLLLKDLFADGMNEAGLSAGLFYHPGFCEYAPYDPEKAGSSLDVTGILAYVLSQATNIEESRALLGKVRMVPIVEPTFGLAPPAQMIINQPDGKSIVVQWLKGKTVITDNPLGVITNAPTFGWHLTNLRNYLNLSATSLPDKAIGELNLAALGGGTGFIGMPGDFTPPSRFVRATAFSKSARKTADGPETMYELFRVLDNFNAPASSVEGTGGAESANLRSGTLWTTAWDMKNRVFYYHTQHNRRVRKLDLKRIDFTQKGIRRRALDPKKVQDIEEITDAVK